MKTTEQIRGSLECIQDARVSIRSAANSVTKDTSMRERFLSVETHLELATEHLLTLYGQAILAEHLNAEILDLAAPER